MIEYVCDGSSRCTAPVHVHGCFADRGSCDESGWHWGKIVARSVVEDGVRYDELIEAPERAIIGRAMLAKIVAGKMLPSARVDAEGVLHLGAPGRGLGVAKYRLGGFVIAHNGHEVTRIDEPAPDESVDPTVPAALVAGLYLAPDSGGDLCLWRDDPDRPGWPEHLAWQGGVDPAVWAIVEAVVPRRDEAPEPPAGEDDDEPVEPAAPAPTFREVVETCYPDLLPRYEEALDEVRAAREGEGAS